MFQGRVPPPKNTPAVRVSPIATMIFFAEEQPPPSRVLPLRLFPCLLPSQTQLVLRFSGVFLCLCSATPSFPLRNMHFCFLCVVYGIVGGVFSPSEARRQKNTTKLRLPCPPVRIRVWIRVSANLNPDPVTHAKRGHKSFLHLKVGL